MNPKVVLFPIASNGRCQGQALGTAEENQEALEQIVGRLEGVIGRFEKLAEQLQWEISGLIYAKGE